MLILGFTIQGTFKPSTYITYISNTIMGGDFVLPKQLEFPPKCTYRQILCPKVYISTKIIHTYTCKHNHTYECKHHSTHTINSRMIHTHSNVEWAHVFSCQQKHAHILTKSKANFPSPSPPWSHSFLSHLSHRFY